MSDIVISLIDKSVKLSKPITSIDDDFANGFLLGEWLNYKNKIDNFSLYLDSNDKEAVLNNFQLLSSAFKALDFDFSEKTKQDIINKANHASSLFIYKLKKFFDRKAIRFDQIKFQPKKDSAFNPFELFDKEDEDKEGLGVTNKEMTSYSAMKNVIVSAKKTKESQFKHVVEVDTEHIAEGKSSGEEGMIVESTQAQRETASKETIEKEERLRGGERCQVSRRQLSNSVGNLSEIKRLNNKDSTNFILRNNKKNISLKKVNELKQIEVNQQFDVDVFIEHLNSLNIKLNESEARMLKSKGAVSSQVFSSEWILNKLREKMNQRYSLKKEKEQSNRINLKSQFGLLNSYNAPIPISKSVAFPNQFNLRLRYEQHREIEKRYNQHETAKRQHFKSIVAFHSTKPTAQANNRYQEENKFSKEVFFTSLERQDFSSLEKLTIDKTSRRQRAGPYISSIMDQILEMADEAYLYQQEQKTDFIDLSEWRHWSVLFIQGKPIRVPVEDEESKEIKSTRIEEDDDAQAFTQYDENEYLNYVDYLEMWRTVPIPAQVKGSKLKMEDVYEEMLKAKKISIDAFEPTEEEMNTVTLPRENSRNYLLGDFSEALVTNRCQQLSMDKEKEKEKETQSGRYSHLTMKLSLFGYPCSGKKSLAKMIKEEHPNIKVYNIEDIAKEKVAEYRRIHTPIEKHPKYKTMKKPQIDQLLAEQEKEIEAFKEMTELLSSYITALDTNPSSEPSDNISFKLLIDQLEKDYPSRTNTEITDEAVSLNKKKTDLLEQLDKLQKENTASKKPKVKEEEALKKELNKITVESFKGFILTDYPRTVQQFAQLEKYFSGYTPETDKPKSEKSLIMGKLASLIDVTLRETSASQLTRGGLDFIINVNVNEKEIKRRYEGIRYDPVANIYYHLEDNPPPNDKIKERLVTPQNLPIEKFNCLMRQHDESSEDIKDFFINFGNEKLNIKSYQSLNGSTSLNEAYKQFKEAVLPLIAKQTEEKAKELLGGGDLKDISPIGTQSNAQMGELSVEARSHMKFVTKKTMGENDMAWNQMLHGESVISQLQEFALNYSDSIKTVLRFINKQSSRIIFRMNLIQKKFIQYLSAPSKKGSLLDIFMTKWRAFINEHSQYLSDPNVTAQYKEDLFTLTDKMWIITQTKKDLSLDELSQIKASGFIENEISAFYLRIESLFINEASKYLLFIDMIRKFYLKGEKPTESFLPSTKDVLTQRITSLQANDNASFDAKVDFLFKGCFILIVKMDERIREMLQSIKAAQMGNETQHKKKTKKITMTVSDKEVNSLEEDMKNMISFAKEQFKYRAMVIKYFAIDKYNQLNCSFESLSVRLDEWIIQNVKYQNDSLNEVKQLLNEALINGEIPSVDSVELDDYSTRYERIEPEAFFSTQVFGSEEKDKQIDLTKMKLFYDEALKYQAAPHLIKTEAMQQLLLLELQGGENKAFISKQIAGLTHHHLSRLFGLLDLQKNDRERYDSFINLPQLMTLLMLVNCTLPTEDDIQIVKDCIKGHVFNTNYCKKEHFEQITFWFEKDISTLFKAEENESNSGSINTKVKNMLFNINKCDNDDKMNLHHFIDVITLRTLNIGTNEYINKTYYEVLFLDK